MARRKEEQLRSLLGKLDDVFFTLDEDQRYVVVLGRWPKVYGRKSQEFVGRTPREILGEKDAKVHEDANRRALKGETVIYE